jgi:hypothetical protein
MPYGAVPWEWRRWLLFKLRRRRIKYSLQTVCRLRQKVVTTDKGQPVITCSPCGKAGPDIRWSLLPMAGEMGLWCRLGPIRKVSPSCREYRFPRVGSLKSPAVTSGTKLAAVVGTAVVPAFAGILSRVGCRGEARQPAIRPSKTAAVQKGPARLAVAAGRSRCHAHRHERSHT